MLAWFLNGLKFIGRRLEVDSVDFRCDLANFKQAWSALAAHSVLLLLILAEGVNRRLKYEV